MFKSPACVSARVLAVSLLALAQTADIASAQSTEPLIQTTATSVDADPLTPKKDDGVRPAAPGAEAPAAASPVAATEAHPAIRALLAKLGNAATGDKAAIAGFYADNGGQPIWTTDAGPSPRALSAVEEFGRAADYGLDSKDAYRTPAAPARFDTVEARADYELALSVATLTYAHHARGGRLDPSKVSATIDMKPRPYEPKSVLAALGAAPDAAAALRRFHPQHAGFQNLQKAYVAAKAKAAPAETLQRIAVNLERWRWMPDDMGAFHVWNNVPEQLTRVYKGSEMIFTEKIVVGKPGHSTPVMSADMLYVIFHPSWGVPNGIKTNEVAPMLRRASARNSIFDGESKRAASALSRHELRVMHNGREIDPDSVDWRTADIRNFNFVQAPSGKNVLGVVKFRFPNRFDVYMHDTQERHLFSHPVRAYSHGCMRVQNPLNLAATILGHDKGWTLERVQAAVKAGRTSDVTLTTPVPVHLTYFTASADETGALTLHGDIYGMDTRVASALSGKPIALASARVSAQEPAARVPRRVAAAGGGEAPFQPFSGLTGN